MDDDPCPPPIEYVVFSSTSIIDNNNENEESSACASSVSDLKDELSVKSPLNKDPILTASTSRTDLFNTFATYGTRSDPIDNNSSNNPSRLRNSNEGMRMADYEYQSRSAPDVYNTSMQTDFCTKSLGGISRARPCRLQSFNSFRSEPGKISNQCSTRANFSVDEHDEELPPDPPLKSILVPQTKLNRTPQVQFSTVEIRRYERILGDNPACPSGPSISIGWTFNDEETSVHLIDEYEYRRTRRLEGSDMTLSKDERFQLLLNLGYSRKEISTAVRSKLKIINKRRRTVHNLHILPVEEIIEGVSKKFSFMMKKRVSSKHLYKEWKDLSMTDNQSKGNEASLSSISRQSSFKNSATKNLKTSCMSELASRSSSHEVSSRNGKLSQLDDEIVAHVSESVNEI